MSARPPRAARALIRLLARREDRPAILHDLAEEFRTMQAEGADLKAARGWYWRQALGSAFPLLRTRLSGWKGSGPGTSLLDIRLGLRMLVKHPGLTIVAIFALAVGIPIGLAPLHSAAVFETPLPVPEPERILIVRDYNVSTNRFASTTMEDWESWRDGLRSFSELGAFIRTELNVGLEDDRDPAVEGAILTASAFRILQENAAMGRTLADQDAQPGGPDVVVVGHAFWQTRLSGDPDVVGSTLRIAGVPHTVVGVMADEFQFPRRANLWLPLRLDGPAVQDARRVVVFGRLVDGVSTDAAHAEVAALGPRLETVEPARRERLQAMASPFTIGLFGMGNDGLDGEVGFYFVQMLALFVLVVACLNIGMLILVRTTARAGELAVRTALGASRTRVVTQLFVEALLLGVVAAGIGLFIADRAADRLTFISSQIPYWIDLGVSLRTTIWALSLAAFSAAVVGVIPALKVTGQQVQQNMQKAKASRAGVRFGGVSSALIVADVALAVIAVGITFAFSDAFSVVKGQGGTVQAREYLFAELGMSAGTGPRSGGLTSEELEARNGQARVRLLEALQSEPGVRSVALATGLPGTEQEHYGVEVDGEPIARDGEGVWASLNSVSPGFFDALDQPIVAGRDFVTGDTDSDTPTAIVNSEFVAEALGGRSPVGRRVRTLRRGVPVGDWIEVVGVVDYVATSNTLNKSEPGIYLAASPENVVPARFAIRTGDNPAAFIPRLRQITQEVDAEAIIRQAIPLADVRSFDEIVLQWMRLGIKVLIGILVLLAASGTYALMSFTVAARTTEIAIRGALGAPRGQILLTIGRRALMQLGVGVGLGMLVVGPMMYLGVASGWSPTMPPILLTLIAGVCVLGAIGLLAFAGPTRQGLRIAPSEALKS